MPSVCLCLRVRLCVGWCSDCGVWSSLSLSLSLSESRLAHVYSGYIGTEDQPSRLPMPSTTCSPRPSSPYGTFEVCFAMDPKP